MLPTVLNMASDMVANVRFNVAIFYSSRTLVGYRSKALHSVIF